MRVPRLLVLLAVVVMLITVPPARTARAVGAWAGASPMEAARNGHVALRLPDGRVLVAGGDGDGTLEVYEPASGRRTGRVSIGRGDGEFAAALLPSGKVMLTGGFLSDPGHYGPGSAYARKAAQVYDPATGTWAALAPMGDARFEHTATVLADGTVLVVGGWGGEGIFGGLGVAPVAGAERYDPGADRWQAAGVLARARGKHTATLLRDGRVLVVGGSYFDKQTVFLATAEVYDPATNRWSAAGSMAAARIGHTATLLNDGRVLVVGGYTLGADGGARSYSSAEVYDPATNGWSSTGRLAVERAGHTATLLPDGLVLVAGGAQFGGAAASSPSATTYTATTELYDPVLGTWAGGANLVAARGRHSATLLGDGTILVAGGQTSDSYSISATERYAQTAPTAQCFAETGKCVGGPFLRYWREHGELAINGYPISGEFIQILGDGRAYTVQYFERVRMEYHPENAAPNDVLLGQFGRALHPADPPVPRPTGPLVQDGFYFEQTGHYVPGTFFNYWYTRGGLAQFGYPLSEVVEERLEDGGIYRVQYFERARFEFHPENAVPYDILLGQFGRARYADCKLPSGGCGVEAAR
jgi:N-acetylneuraminic acid mutarotase